MINDPLASGRVYDYKVLIILHTCLYSRCINKSKTIIDLLVKRLGFILSLRLRWCGLSDLINVI